MFDYDYVGEAFLIDDHKHHAFQVFLNGAHVANGVDVSFPDGAIAIRIFDYDKELMTDLHSFFDRDGVREVTFSRAM